METPRIILDELRQVFTKIAGEDKKIHLTEFKKALGLKDEYFADRLFSIFDTDSSGTIKIEEFLTTVENLVFATTEEKLQFAYQLHDINGDDGIEKAEIAHLITASLNENNLSFKPEEINDLVDILFLEADSDNSGAISFTEFKGLIGKFPDLIEAMTVSPISWLRAHKQNSQTTMNNSTADDLSSFPLFHEQLEMHFPGGLPLTKYMEPTFQYLQRYGFEDENTLGVIATCRDEITEPLLDEVIKYWGQTFNFSSLGGFVFAGKTGVSAFLSHTPFMDNIGRFVWYAMPHLAISQDGKIGYVHREGMGEISHACGSLISVVKELDSGRINFFTDPDTLEQCTIRRKNLSSIHYGKYLDTLSITKLACQIISDYLKRILTRVAPAIYNYGVLTGILIHGPNETDGIYPHDHYVVGWKICTAL